MKALALFSGGLDSLLAIKIIQDLGIEVLALHFNIGFGSKSDKSEILRQRLNQVGTELEIIDIRRQFFDEILFQPKFGYGKYFNPCIDCHGNMFAHALKLLESKQANFVISGEVLGQRPKSQRAEALGQVEKLSTEKQSGSAGLIVRPLSAKLLPPTIPEQRGWIPREKLLDISGRGRNRQLELVQQYGIEYYERPGGGCLLTETSIANKLKDLQSHREIVFEDMELVKFGRYMILPNGARCVIARNEEENQKLNFPHPKMSPIELLDCIGPLGLVESNASLEDKNLAISLTLLYGKTQPNKPYKVCFEGKEIESFAFESKEKAQKFLLQ
ncbi:argininosuccinate synthase domain-containing protein [Helicobacter sp. MIT 05-5294]|uniref:argininosuccinate synthase domain-containing protein n=1 Tax=Helicobacter sp. MIT 05-5294 TaxID=1548150 RepID=UPI00051FE00F|nr:argininosuccinate synthase domain-containing protein [Helicobacter sp. MIT 05-5294]TLD88674.1 ATP-binding protein [Helicobacter sp. MIT 05-5294]